MALFPNSQPLVIESSAGNHRVCAFDGQGFVGIAKGPGEQLGLPIAARAGVTFVVSTEGAETRAVLVRQGERAPQVSCF